MLSVHNAAIGLYRHDSCVLPFCQKLSIFHEFYIKTPKDQKSAS